MRRKFFTKLIAYSTLLPISVSVIPSYVYAVWPDCSKLNKNGQFTDETCAIVDSVERINNGEKFIKLENVGRDSEYNLLFFDNSEIKGILSNLTYSKDMAHSVATKEQQLEEENKVISDSIYSLGIGGTSLFVLKNIFGALSLRTEDGNRFLREPLGELNLLRYRIQNVAILIPLAVSIGVSALISSFACMVNNYFSRKDIANFAFEEKIKKDNYFSILRSMLEYIESGMWNKDKILCISTNLDNNEMVAQLLDKKVSKNHSLDEQNKFDESIKNLEDSIKSILSSVNE